MRQLVPFVVTTIVVKSAQASSQSGDDKAGMQVIEEGIQTLKSLATSCADEARKWTLLVTSLSPLRL